MGCSQRAKECSGGWTRFNTENRKHVPPNACSTRSPRSPPLHPFNALKCSDSPCTAFSRSSTSSPTDHHEVGASAAD